MYDNYLFRLFTLLLLILTSHGQLATNPKGTDVQTAGKFERACKH